MTTAATNTLARATPAPTSPIERRADDARASDAGRRAALLAICLVAFALRAGVIIARRAWLNPNAMEHRSIARSLYLGLGFKFFDWDVFQYTSVQSPPYPYLLYVAFKLFGLESSAAFGAMLALNAIVGALTCWILYHAVRAVGGAPRVALVAAALLAVWPTQVFATTAAQAITLITACTVAIVALFYRSVDTRRTAPWFGYGLIGCLAALTEPVLLPFMALSGVLILIWRGVPTNVRVRNAAVLFACAVAVLAPWTIRNLRVHGKLVPVKSTFWVNMWKGNNEHASGTDRLVLTEARREASLRTDSIADASVDAGRQYDLLTPEQVARLKFQPEVEREAIFGEFAKTFIREHPGHYAQLCARRFWKTVWVEADSPKAHGLAQYLFYWTPRTLLLVLTPVGLVLARRRGWRMTIPLLIAGLALTTHTLTIAAARFAFPYEPFQIALVALVCTTLFDRRRDRRIEAAA